MMSTKNNIVKIKELKTDGMRQYAEEFQAKVLAEAQEYRKDVFDEAGVDDYENEKQTSKPVKIFKGIFWTMVIIGTLLAIYLIPFSIVGLV